MLKCFNEDCQYFREHGECHEICTEQGIAKIITNADRIRAMSDEELAEFLFNVNNAYTESCMMQDGNCKWEDYPTHDKGCKDCFLEYLKTETK